RAPLVRQVRLLPRVLSAGGGERAVGWAAPLAGPGDDRSDAAGRPAPQRGPGSQRPATIQSTDTALRLFAGFVLDHDPKLRSARQVQRAHIEAYKTMLTTPREPDGRSLKNNTVRMRLGMLRVFFERIIEWGWDDSPARCPVFVSDLPRVDDPLPRFLDDASA